MPTEDVLAHNLRELEESLLLASVRKPDRVDQLLAEGFIEFGSSGRIFTKEQIVAPCAPNRHLALLQLNSRARSSRPALRS